MAELLRTSAEVVIADEVCVHKSQQADGSVVTHDCLKQWWPLCNHVMTASQAHELKNKQSTKNIAMNLLETKRKIALTGYPLQVQPEANIRGLACSKT